jgi:Ca2+-binding EF-hand superfamily protein
MKKALYSNKLPPSLQRELKHLFAHFTQSDSGIHLIEEDDYNLMIRKSEREELPSEKLLIYCEGARHLLKKYEEEEPKEIEQQYIEPILERLEAFKEINFENFVKLMETPGFLANDELSKNLSEKTLSDYETKFLFNLVSKDGDIIQKDDLIRIGKEIGEKINEKDAEEMIKYCSKEGKIDVDSFKNILI